MPDTIDVKTGETATVVATAVYSDGSAGAFPVGSKVTFDCGNDQLAHLITPGGGATTGQVVIDVTADGQAVEVDVYAANIGGDGGSAPIDAMVRLPDGSTVSASDTAYMEVAAEAKVTGISLSWKR